MSLLSRKTKHIDLTFTPGVNGLKINLFLLDGTIRLPLSFPLTDVTPYYKLEGFEQYMACDDLNDNEIIKDGVLPYDVYYDLLSDDVAVEVLKRLNLPVEPAKVKGQLILESLPKDGQLSCTLRDESGRNLDRIGTEAGCFYQRGNEYILLPQAVFRLKQSLQSSYSSGLEKVAVCQSLATAAGLAMDEFLSREHYNLIETYELDVKVHAPDHIEIVPIVDGVEVKPFVTSVKEGWERERYVPSPKVRDDVEHLRNKRHIRGVEVPLFLDNPSAVLPEHDYVIDLDGFSDRVKGLVEIERIHPMKQPDQSRFSWFDEQSGRDLPFDDNMLRQLMTEHPNEQYVQYDGRWVYLDPVLRRELTGDGIDGPPRRSAYALDIFSNEEALEYTAETGEEPKLPEYELPKDLKATLFPHQESGYQWLCRLDDENRGGLLADDMGLGKTLQVIAFFSHLYEQGNLGPSLIVVPIALVDNWVEELNRFAPALPRPYIHLGSGRFRNYEQISGYELIVTSYDTLKLDQLVLGKISFRAIVCDEAQNVKSFSSQRSRALRAMKSQFRLAMTGTPVENSLDELWAIMDYVQPGCLNSLKEFRDIFEAGAANDQLISKLRPYYLRRTKDEVLKDKLPVKHILEPHLVLASKEQQSLSKSMLEGMGQGNFAILNILTQLRQMYGHPGAVAPIYETLADESVPKLHEVLKILDDVSKRGEKALIFTEFRRIQSLLKRAITSRYGISVSVVNGESKSKQLQVQSFNNSPGFGVMLLSPKAAGVGLTITSANHVIHYTRWWNPAVENQATDRAYRIGQTKDVYVHHVITSDPINFPNGTVEELMHSLLESKRELAENVVVPFDISSIQREMADRFSR